MIANLFRQSVLPPAPWVSIFTMGCSIGLSLFAAPALTATKVSAIYGPLEVSMLTSDIETFAKTGTMSENFKTYAQILKPQQQAELRSVLQEKLEANPQALERFGGTSMGKELLQRLSNVLQTDPGQDGGALLLKGMVSAAKDPQGLTVLSLIRNFPADNLRIKVEPLLQAQKELTALLKYRDTTVTAVTKEMDAEAVATPKVDFAQKLDLRKPGPFKFTRKTLDLSNNRGRQSILGNKIGLQFKVEMYLPEGQSQPAPIVVISHGLGSAPIDFGYLAEHFASYGFAVALPEHIGSDNKRLESILEGRITGDVSPVEFVDRPLDIAYLLDELSRLSSTDPTLKGRLNLQQIGVIGHSFGGYTSLALAGAPLNYARLREQCLETQPTFNLSLILQCRAKALPPFNYNLADSRIKAAIAINPLTSAIFGPEGMANIQVPTLLISGSHDVVTPAIPEQIHPFLWLTTPHKYLALLSNAGHTFSVYPPQQQRESLTTSVKGLQSLLAGADPKLSREYLQALSLAFMQTYLGNRPEARSYLSAAYAKYITRKPVKLGFVQSLTPTDLQQAYRLPLPIPIVPPSNTAVASSREKSMLQTIRETGVLKAGIRATALPFGALDNKGQATGYCVDLLNLMTQQLQAQLNTPVKLQLVPSSLLNRFSMVQEQKAQLECGPNTITATPAAKTVFSTPFFITGTHFLVKTADKPRIDPKNFAQDVTVGTYSQTTTTQFIEQQYPKTKKVYFQGEQAQTEAIQALKTGKIDALAGDGILLVATLNQQNLSSSFTLVPEQPLTCDAYGLILPEGDRPWENTVNQIIGSEPARQVWDKWFKSLYPYIYLNIDYCADRP
jgi:predicted dienelactone hydrolase